MATRSVKQTSTNRESEPTPPAPHFTRDERVAPGHG